MMIFIGCDEAQHLSLLLHHSSPIFQKDSELFLAGFILLLLPEFSVESISILHSTTSPQHFGSELSTGPDLRVQCHTLAPKAAICADSRTPNSLSNQSHGRIAATFAELLAATPQ